jgi:phospholipase D1/2
MNGQDYKAGKFAHTLRMQLFREHLGLLDNPEIDIRDPVSEHFYRNIWQQTAATNTEIYDEVFQCVPTDKCETFLQFAQYQTQHLLSITDPVRARILLKDVSVSWK